MTDIIQLLPDSIANQIAAGEVIQRPASAVKELLENAVDAGGTRIKLIIKDAGKTLIQVADNGCGMSPTDARLCFERHATSKIKQATDLFDIQTLGFRGEALASIAAIAHVELKTRQKGQAMGTRILIEGSKVRLQEPCQCPEGTSFAIKNLFFNVPARRNFLKSHPVETRHIIEEFQRVALANPKIAFSLHNNNSEIFRLPAASLRKRIVGVFGHNFNQRLIPVEEDLDFLRIYGFVGKPKYARKTRGEQYFFANERFIKSNYLHHAVTKAYEELLPEKTHPLYIIFMDITPARIDVNVHPTKQEINFDDEKVVYTFVNAAVKRALGTYTHTPTIDFDKHTTFQNMGFDLNNANIQPSKTPKTELSPKVRTLKSKIHESVNQSNKKQNTKTTINKESEAKKSSDEGGLTLKKGAKFNKKQSGAINWEELYKTADIQPVTSPKQTGKAAEQPRTIILQSNFDEQTSLDLEEETGSLHKKQQPYQLHQRYILSQIKSGFILIDQQAAHERILYERYQKYVHEQSMPTQKQLFPQTIELPPVDATLLKAILPDINALGYDIQEFGKTTFIVHGTPADVGSTDNQQATVESLIEQYKFNAQELNLTKRDNIARTMAYQASTKTGQMLSVSEMSNLIDQLFACQTPFVAPNGRPTFVKYNLLNIQKQFGKKNG